MAVTASIAKHWIHERFAENLLNASHSRELSEAAAEWELFDKFHYHSLENLHCHFCGTGVRNYAVLKNMVNGNKLVIGLDCYDKFLDFIVSGKIRSVLPHRKEYDKSLRDNWKKVVRQYGGNETFLGWLREQLMKKILPQDITQIMETLERFKSAPTYAEADAIVEHYKDTRKLPIETLIERDRLHYFQHKKLLPKHCTINEASKLIVSMERHREFFIGLREKERQERIRREREEYQRRQEERRRKIEESLGPITTLEQARATYSRAVGNRDNQRVALEKWEAFSMQEIKKVSSIQEARVACDRTPPKSEARETAIEKWLSFITTVEQAHAACKLAARNSAAEKAALEKLNSLIIQRIKNATSPEEVDTACSLAPRNSAVAETKLHKLCSLILQKIEQSTTFEEAEVVCDRLLYEYSSRSILATMNALVVNAEQAEKLYSIARTFYHPSKTQVRDIKKKWTSLLHASHPHS